MGEHGSAMYRRSERGSMTVLVVGLVSALMVAALVATGLAGLVATQHRAAAAADLAALAGAARAAGDRAPDRRTEDPCDVARRVAAANAAELASCERSGVVVTVEVVVEPHAPLGLRPTIRSRARAGPADVGDGG